MLWENKKMLVTSIFSFSHNVLKRILSKGRLKSVLCGKGLIRLVIDYKQPRVSTIPKDGFRIHSGQ